MTVDAELVDNIAIEEGSVTVNGRHVAYDDANRQHIVAGTHVVGNPTIGHGRLITSGNGLSDEEADYLLANDVAAAQADAAKLPAFACLNQAQRDALTDIDFNVGGATIRDFQTFLGLLARRQPVAAAQDLRGTLWYRQVGPNPGERGWRIAQILETGVWIDA